MDGIGVGKNIVKAATLYQAAAKNDDTEAQFEYANCSYYGLGAKQSFRTATYWYTKAADKGHAAQ